MGYFGRNKIVEKRNDYSNFLKGLQPNIRQHVLQFNPPDFEAAIALARSQEINASLVPLDKVSSAAISFETHLSEMGLKAIIARYPETGS